MVVVKAVYCCQYNVMVMITLEVGIIDELV